MARLVMASGNRVAPGPSGSGSAGIRKPGGTVKTHLTRISARLGLRDRVQLVVWAHRSGIVEG